MEELQQAGKIAPLASATSILTDWPTLSPSTVAPAVNQIEVNPFNQQLHAFHGIKAVAFSRKPGHRLLR
jgi:2,5-diketo-D-gluconate reductase A